MYVLISDSEIVKYPYTVLDLRRDNPNTSFPDPMLESELAEWGVFPVVPRNPPSHDQATQNVIRVNPTMENGQWVETWQVEEVPAEEITERLASQWAVVRAQRGDLLMTSDWTQLADVPMTNEEKAAWATYRQALRDVTTQEDPFQITWPDTP